MEHLTVMDNRQDRRELTAQQRAAKMTRLFMLGNHYTTSEVAEKVGLTHAAAWNMLCNISSEVPIRLDMMDRKWKLIGRHIKD